MVVVVVVSHFNSFLLLLCHLTSLTSPPFSGQGLGLLMAGAVSVAVSVAVVMMINRDCSLWMMPTLAME